MDEFKHSSIDFNAIQACDDQLSDNELERHFRDELKVPFVNITQRLVCVIEQQNGICTLRGRIGFWKLTEGLKHFIKQFCCRSQNALLLNFDETLFPLVLSSNSFKVSHQIKLRSFSMGTMARLNSFIVHFASERAPFRKNDFMASVSSDDLLARFIHSKNELHIHFRVILTPRNKKSTVKYKYQRFKLLLTYKSVNHLILQQNDQSLSTFISTASPANLYVLKKDVNERTVANKDYENEDEKEWNETSNYGIHFEKDHWIRRTECHIFEKDRAQCKAKEILGRCNVLKLDLFEHPALNEVAPHELDNYPCPFEVINSMVRFKKCPTYFGCVREISKDPPQNVAIRMVHEDSFKIVYALSSLQSVSFQFANDLFLNSSKNKMEANLKEELESFSIDTNSLPSSQKIEVFERSLFDLFHVIQSGTFVLSLFFLRNAIERNAQEMLHSSVTKHIYQIRRAILTPTRTLLLPPLPVMESRFLKRSDPDYVLRLTLRDDDYQSLAFSLRMMEERDKHRFTRECVKRPLTIGIRIGDRCYEVVGSSPSQMRDNGMCLYATDKTGNNAKKIRSKFGIINETNISKFAARVGLMLSQSQFFTDVNDARIKYDEPDIKHDNAKHPISKKRYDFSDGCGMISLSYAEKLTKKLKDAKCLPEDALMPSAFQIRLGGCKGMIVVNPLITRHDIVIRNSMKKFDSDDKELGVLKVSDMRMAYLNQPFITLLNQLGVGTNVFLQMQLNVLQDILHSFLTECNAANILKQYSSLKSFIDYDRLIAAKVNILNEPFFRLSLDNVIRHTMNLLKTKSRIMVPFKDGRTMFGVVDETRTLKYGEVFVQSTVNFDNRSETEIWKGDVLVTKFPCMAPGDVRILKAIDVKALHHIKDCIVFPAEGKRPHPNEMAGSDLDGDEYAVIRYKPLLNIRMKDAMVYPDSVSSNSNDNVKVEFDRIEQLAGLYAASIENDSVGVIAKAHIAWADMLPMGIMDDKCIKLALDYSRALDSPKTGEKVVLQKDQRPMVTPDFMEKFAFKPTYLSKRALGSLFRQICLFQIVFNEQNPLQVQGVDQELFTHPSWQEYAQQARAAYNEYKSLIINIQKLFKIASESEIITGLYNTFDEFLSSKEETSDSRKMVYIILRNGINRIRQLFDENCSDEQKLAKASAYYKVTRTINSTTSNQFYGLPWLFGQYLSVLALRNRNEMTPFEDEESRINYLAGLIDDRLIKERKFTPIDTGDDGHTTCVSLAKNIVASWLQRQTHLKLTLLNSKVLAENMVDDVIPKGSERNVFLPRPSVGLVVMKVLKTFVSKELNPEFGTSSEEKQFKYTAGFSAMMALYRLYRTHLFDHIILPRNSGPMNSDLICPKTFRMQFNVNSKLYEFFVKNEFEFLKYIRSRTGVSMIKGQWCQRTESSWYFELIAFGTQTHMYGLGFFLSKILFSNGPNIISRMESAICSGSSQSPSTS